MATEHLKRKRPSPEASHDQPAPQKTKKEGRLAQKAQTEERKRAKDANFDAHAQARQLWERARSKKVSSQERKSLVGDILACFRNGDDVSGIGQACLKHDLSRVFQTCLRYGRQEDKLAIAKGLVGLYVDVAMNKYGKFILAKLLEACPLARELAVQDFKGRVQRLVTSKESSGIIDQLYTRYLTPAQRHELVGEFYGREFVVFNKDTRSLAATLEKNPAKRPIVMDNIRSVLDAVFVKENMHHSIVHRLMLDYLTWEENKVRLGEWTASLFEIMPEIVATDDGSRAASRCMAQSGAKERKTIVRSLKEKLPALARGEHSHKFILALLASVDDTKLTGKGVVEPLLLDLMPVVKNVNARRVVLFLLGGRSPFYIPEETGAALDEVAALNTGKKDAAVRAKELRTQALGPVVRFCVEEWEEMTKNAFQNGVLVEALCAGQEEELEPLVEKLLEEIRSAAEALPLANLLKKIARRAEAPLAHRIYSVVAPKRAVFAEIATDIVGRFPELEPTQQQTKTDRKSTKPRQQ